MIVTLLTGGLGNQMFQYAAARRLALRRATDVRVDLRAYDDDGHDRRPAGLEAFRRAVRLFELAVQAAPATDADIFPRLDPFLGRNVVHRAARAVQHLCGGRLFRSPTHIRERSFRFDPAVLDLPDGVYLQGFWQSWRYFADVADTIRRDLRPADPAVERVRATPHSGSGHASGGPVVSLHVRRGDLAHAAEVLKDPTLVFGPPVGLDYLRAASARFDPPARFLVFSDSPAEVEWCKRHLPAAGLPGDRLHYADQGNPDVLDLATMSACDHHVIANSTFSWWAAWLNATPGRRVVAPRLWFPAGTTLGTATADLIPPDWDTI